MRVTFPLIPAASTSAVSVQVSGFEDIGLLTHCDRLVCDSCSSGQCFACGFLQIPPRGGHPCRPANRSPCRADRGLPPPSHPATTTVTRTAPVTALRAMPGARNKNPAQGRVYFVLNRALRDLLGPTFSTTVNPNVVQLSLPIQQVAPHSDSERFAVSIPVRHERFRPSQPCPRRP